MDKEEIMNQCIKRARRTMNEGYGGPFGAAVVKDGEILSITSNLVMKHHDPTAHAEIVAIREACRLLNTHDLSGCELYATGYPCPMCLSAIIWANIHKVHVAAMPEDAEKIGFRDSAIYEYLGGESDYDFLELDTDDISRELVKDLYQEYHLKSMEVY